MYMFRDRFQSLGVFFLKTVLQPNLMVSFLLLLLFMSLKAK